MVVSYKDLKTLDEQEVVTPEEVIAVAEHFAENGWVIPGQHMKQQILRAFSTRPPSSDELTRLENALDKGKNNVVGGGNKIEWVVVTRMLIDEGWLQDE